MSEYGISFFQFLDYPISVILKLLKVLQIRRRAKEKATAIRDRYVAHGDAKAFDEILAAFSGDSEPAAELKSNVRRRPRN